MREYLESYSNLAYNIVGIIGYLINQDILFCMALQAMGAASFTYHWHKTRPIFLFDWWGMMFMLSIITGIIVPYDWIWIYVMAWNVIYPYFIIGKLSVYIEVALTAIPCLIALFIFKPLLVALIVSAIFGVAIWIRSKDPDPKQARVNDSIAHSAWHVLTAIDLFFACYLDVIIAF